MTYPLRDTANVAMAAGTVAGLGTLLACVGPSAAVSVGAGGLALGASTVLATALGAQLSAGVGSADVPVMITGESLRHRDQVTVSRVTTCSN